MHRLFNLCMQNIGSQIHPFSGVVERASKELSRRFTSFAARTRRTAKHEKLEDITENTVEQSDQLNGNAEPANWGDETLGDRETKTKEPKATMGITRGTVMDKVRQENHLIQLYIEYVPYNQIKLKNTKVQMSASFRIRLWKLFSTFHLYPFVKISKPWYPNSTNY